MRITAWGINIDLITINQLIQIVEDNINRLRLPMQVSGINPEIIIKTISNDNLKYAINNSAIVNIDGVSVALALRMLGYSGVKRIPCPDVFDILLDQANKNEYKIFLLGAKEEVVKEMINKLQKDYINLKIVGYHNGYFNQENECEIASLIKSSNADMLFLGMPSPKKELFISSYLTFLNVPLCFGVGGVFDIKAGIVKRAPKWMQKIGLEWMFRLIQEPKRLIKRQRNIFKFFILFLKTFRLNKKRTF